MRSTRNARRLIVFSILALLLSGCVIGQNTNIDGSGVIGEDPREVSGISSVEMATQGTLIITQGDTESFVMESEDNFFAYIVTEVDDKGQFTIIGRSRIHLFPTEPIIYRLTVKDLDAIKVSSTGNVEMGELTTDSLEVVISGEGSLEIAGGKVASQNIKLSSSGNYNAENLECAEAVVKLTKSGSASLWVTDSLTGEISGDGGVEYRGSPTVDVTISGTGEVVQVSE